METDLNWNRFAYFVASRQSVRFKSIEANFLFYENYKFRMNITVSYQVYHLISVKKTPALKEEKKKQKM